MGDSSLEAQVELTENVNNMFASALRFGHGPAKKMLTKRCGRTPKLMTLPVAVAASPLPLGSNFYLCWAGLVLYVAVPFNALLASIDSTTSRNTVADSTLKYGLMKTQLETPIRCCTIVRNSTFEIIHTTPLIKNVL